MLCPGTGKLNLYGYCSPLFGKDLLRLQFFFNFGPNATTFIIPAEAFPSRVRGQAHGLSAAAGKMGAILSALLFNYLSSNVIGLPNVLWIFFACNLLGAVATIFLIPETKDRDADLIDYEEFQAAQTNRAENIP
jgi:PHS family inorganic phosphate transporter-like MFS transporter